MSTTWQVEANSAIARTIDECWGDDCEVVQMAGGEPGVVGDVHITVCHGFEGESALGSARPAWAMEFTCPGVPVEAWASILPTVSKTPADKSPASDTTLLNAVRMMVCACSSTIAINRSHITWRSMRNERCAAAVIDVWS